MLLIDVACHVPVSRFHIALIAVGIITVLYQNWLNDKETLLGKS